MDTLVGDTGSVLQTRDRVANEGMSQFRHQRECWVQLEHLWPSRGASLPALRMEPG